MSAVTIKYTHEKGLSRNPGQALLPSGVVLGGMAANEPRNVNLGMDDIQALKGCRGWSVKPYKAETAEALKAAGRRADKEAEVRKKETKDRREKFAAERSRQAAKPTLKPKAEKKEPKA